MSYILHPGLSLPKTQDVVWENEHPIIGYHTETDELLIMPGDTRFISERMKENICALHGCIYIGDL